MQKKELQRAGKEKEQVHNKKPESLARKKRIWIFFRRREFQRRDRQTIDIPAKFMGLEHAAQAKRGGRGQGHRVSLLVQQQPGPAVLLINGSPAAKMGIVLLHSHPCRPGTADFYQTFTIFFDNLQVLSENIAELSTGFVSLSKSGPPPCCPLSSRHLP